MTVNRPRPRAPRHTPEASSEASGEQQGSCGAAMAELQPWGGEVKLSRLLGGCLGGRRRGHPGTGRPCADVSAAQVESRARARRARLRRLLVSAHIDRLSWSWAIPTAGCWPACSRRPHPPGRRHGRHPRQRVGRRPCAPCSGPGPAVGSDHFVQGIDGQPGVVIGVVDAVVRTARDHTRLPLCTRLFSGPRSPAAAKTDGPGRPRKVCIARGMAWRASPATLASV
jgi:hypothetical protein